jgi:DNA-binding NarL/FixJ family response regulator
VLLVSDQALLCAALVAIIGNERGFEIVGATRVAGAIEMARTLRIDLVITNLSAEQKEEREFLADLRRCHAHVALLVLRSNSKAECARIAPAAGADAYVSMAASSAELLVALRAIGTGQRHLGPRFLRLPRDAHFASRQPARGAQAHITPRQREIIKLIAAGLSSKRIALTMNRSVKTVEKHRSDLMRRLDLHNSAEVTRFAMHSGIASEREMARV